MSTASLITLGRFELRVDGRLVPQPPTRKARALIACLIGREGRDISREQLVEAFWPEADPESGRRSLNTALSSVRACLREAGLDGTALLYGDKSIVRWTPASSSDYLRLKALVGQAAGANAEEAIEICGGEFLEGDYDEWAAVERARIAQDFEKVLADAVRLHRNVAAAKALIALDPYHELAQEVAIESELRSGRRGVAAALFDACRRAFGEAGIEPPASLQRRFGTLERAAEVRSSPPLLRFEVELNGARTTPGAMSAPTFARRFIGRDVQLDALLQRLNAAHDGFGSTVLVAGEAGIGKTRIVRELRARCGDDVNFALGQSAEHFPSPLAPFAEALNALNRKAPAVLSARPALVSSLAFFLPQLEGSPAADGDARHAIDAFSDALTLFAAERTTVVALEDVQWADAASLRLAVRIQERIAASRLLLVATHRVGEPEFPPGFTAALAEVARAPSTWRLTLEPLPRRAMNELVRDAARGSARISESTMLSVVARAEGNPLFAEELLQAATESPPEGEGIALPPTVHAAVSDRLRRLSIDGRRLLLIASAAGRRFSPEIVAEVAARSLDDAIAAMREARALQLLDLEGGATFAFRHALIHDAIYGELMSSERRGLHARFLEVLEAQPDHLQNAEELARHAWEAHELSKVVVYAQAAAEAAMRLDAHEDAERLLRGALAAEPDEWTRAKILRSLAKALYLTGNARGAIEAIEPAIEFYRSVGAPALEADALLAARHYYHDAAVEIDRGERAVRRALELLESDPASDGAAMFSALVDTGELMLHSQQPGRVLEVLGRAECFVSSAHPNDLQRFYQNRACARAAQGDIAGCRSDFAASREIAERCGNHSFVVVSLCNECLRMMQYGATDRVVETARALSEVTARQDSGVRTLAIAQSMQAWAAAEHGDFHGAREFIRGYLGSEFHLPFVLEVAFCGIGIPVGLRLGDEELVRSLVKPDMVERAFASGAPANVPFAALACVELYRGRGEHERAAALLARALDVACEVPKEGSDHFPFLYVQVAAAGYPADIPRARGRLAHYADNELFKVARAHLGLFDAYAAERAGDPSSAVRNGSDAAKRFEALRMPYYEALARQLAGEPDAALALHRATGNVRDAAGLSRRHDAPLIATRS